MRITKESDFYKNCPDCSKILYYSKKYKLERSIKNNSRCFTCSARARVKDPNYSKKLSDAVKKSWENNYIRKHKQSKYAKEQYSSESRRKEQSEKVKNFWKNISEEKRKEITKKMSDNFDRSEERIEKIRQTSIKLWKDNAFREKWEKSNSSTELSLKRRECLLKQINNPNSKLNSKEVKEKRSNSFKLTWLNKSEEDKNKALENLAKTLHSFHSKSRSTSKLELWVFNNIKHLGFEHKGTIAGYCIDIKHSIFPIIVEVNGDFWHANPNLYSSDWVNSTNKLTAQQIWDKDKQRLLKINNKGYYVHVLWQKNIKNNKSYIQDLEKIVNLFELFY